MKTHRVRNFLNRIQHHVRALDYRTHVPGKMGTATESDVEKTVSYKIIAIHYNWKKKSAALVAIRFATERAFLWTQMKRLEDFAMKPLAAKVIFSARPET